jgi:hypothetical protein
MREGEFQSHIWSGSPSFAVWTRSDTVVGAHFGRASQPARNGPSEDELIGQADGSGESSPKLDGERDDGFISPQGTDASIYS